VTAVVEFDFVLPANPVVRSVAQGLAQILTVSNLPLKELQEVLCCLSQQTGQIVT
jgi:hypothetical protein